MKTAHRFPAAARADARRGLEKMKELRLCETDVSLRGALNKPAKRRWTLYWRSSARSRHGTEVHSRLSARCLKSKTSSLSYLDNNMALSDAEAENGSTADVLCGCALTPDHGCKRMALTVALGFRRHEVCYMDSYHRSAP